MKEYVESKGCTFISAVKQKQNFKMKIISSCGHESETFFNNFKGKSTGIVCKDCVILASYNKKNYNGFALEEKGISMIEELINTAFDICRTREGALADFLIRPKDIPTNTWYAVQLKTVSAINTFQQYSFGIKRQTYPNCILIFNVISENRIWCFPKDTTLPKSRLNIGKTSKGKYAQYEVDNNNLANHLHSILSQYRAHPLSYWNKSTSCCDLEDYFADIRKTQLDFLDYELPTRNGMVYDFIINDYKIQEKSISTANRKNKTITFTLKKCNGNTRNNDNTKTRKYKAYDIGDNDFYWLWCKESDLFYIIPETILVTQNIIGPEAKGNLTIPNKGVLDWITPYTFNIKNIDESAIKSLFGV